MTTFLDDPVAAGAHTFAGYLQKNPLTQLESDLVFYFIQARLYQNICYATNTSELHPENSEYLLYSVKRAWKVLDKLTTVSKKEFDEKWAKLCIPNWSDGITASNLEIVNILLIPIHQAKLDNF